jgi:hypothetical protein
MSSEPVYLFRLARPQLRKQDLVVLRVKEDQVEFVQQGHSRKFLLDPADFAPGQLHGLAVATTSDREGLLVPIECQEEAKPLAKTSEHNGLRYQQYHLYRCSAAAWGSSSWGPRFDPAHAGRAVIAPRHPCSRDALALGKDVGGGFDEMECVALADAVGAWQWVGAVRCHAAAHALQERVRDSPNAMLRTIAGALEDVESGNYCAEVAFKASETARAIQDLVAAEVPITRGVLHDKGLLPTVIYYLGLPCNDDAVAYAAMHLAFTLEES